MVHGSAVAKNDRRTARNAVAPGSDASPRARATFLCAHMLVAWSIEVDEGRVPRSPAGGTPQASDLGCGFGGGGTHDQRVTAYHEPAELQLRLVLGGLEPVVWPPMRWAPGREALTLRYSVDRETCYRGG